MNPASEAKKNFTKFCWRVRVDFQYYGARKTWRRLHGAAQIEPACYGELSTAKPHRDLVRAVSSARYADSIRIGSPTTAVDVIGIETTVVRHGDNQHAVAIDVDETRGRPTPEEVHRLQAVHFVTTRVQRDLHRCRCGCRRRSCSSRRCWRCGCCRGRRSRRRWSKRSRCRCSRGWCGSSTRAWTGRFHRGRGTAAGTAAGHEPACVEQASGRATLVVCAVLRPGPPHIGARVVDPHLLVDRQTQAADYPDFTVNGEPASCLAGAARGGQRRNGAPGVRSRVICKLCAWRCPAAYHVDLTVEQHPGHVALACGHRRPVGIAVGHRIVDKDLIVACAYRIVPTDHVHQVVKSNRRPTGARRGQIQAITPSVGGGVIDLHHVQRATELDAVEPTRDVDDVADGCGTGLGVRDWDGRSRSPHAAVEEVGCGYVWVDAVEAGEHVEGVVG